MKQLIFIDNDDSDRSSEDIDQVKNNLEYIGKLPEEYINQIQIVSDFFRLDRDEQFNMMFNKETVVCTWSMFTATHFNSLGQLFRFLTTAGSAEIDGLIHIDCSGMLIKALRNNIADCKYRVVNILTAIENNYVLCVDFDTRTICRVRVDLTINNNSWFKLEPINLLELLKKEK